MSEELTLGEMWRAIITGENPVWRKGWRLRRLIPSSHRCKNCNAPFEGIGGLVMRLTGRGRYERNPRFCDFWFEFCRTHPGGAEVDLSLLFVDVRGSTPIAERMSAADFSRLMNRFYAAATDVLIKTDAFIDKLVGDEVIGMYLPIFTGPNHARPAVQAAQELLRATGHHEPSGPWLPVGVGVHTGTAFFGTVTGAEGTFSDFTALGDNVNITARLASSAGAGEALISDAAYQAAGLSLGDLEQRQLELKGKSEPVSVRVVRASPD